MRRTLDTALRRQIRAAAPAPAEEPTAPVWKPGFGEEAEPPAAVRLPGEEPEETGGERSGKAEASGGGGTDPPGRSKGSGTGPPGAAAL